MKIVQEKEVSDFLDDLEPCTGVVDGIDMVLDGVGSSLHCLIKVLTTRPDLIYSQRFEVPFSACNAFQNFISQCSK